MSDVLIRDVPDDVLAAIDSRAHHLGMSRNEYLRRRLSQEAVRTDETVTAAHLRRFAHSVRDLGDREVMDQAWS
ncbi:FitA-like ribbon-helix-helix domain-containing protein [Kribbella sp. DT2]|uniref:type II toxin-antitoxin system VapB family antitoxin n=1 Tax=Kribbella sp. DT2 TaxID=3393427 RepID=UPI003CF1E579